MNNPYTATIQAMFASRLDTLTHLLEKGKAAFANDASFLERRIAPDMAPFGTQIAFTCNQPRNFALWSQGKPADNLDPDVPTLQQAEACLRSTRELLATVSEDDSRLAATTRVDLVPGMYLEVSGFQYVNDFLVPNFYFHLVTAYDILRMAGVSIGKGDYMLHLAPFIRHG